MVTDLICLEKLGSSSKLRPHGAAVQNWKALTEIRAKLLPVEAREGRLAGTFLLWQAAIQIGVALLRCQGPYLGAASFPDPSEGAWVGVPGARNHVAMKIPVARRRWK